MNYEIVELPERHLIGLTIRTSNASPDASKKIGALWEKFQSESTQNALPALKTTPYTCYGLYYDYNDQKGDYAMMVGGESTANPPSSDFEELTIPAGRYAKLSVHGNVADAVIAGWQDIWNDKELTAQRAFTVDFEAYPSNTAMDDADIDLYVALR